MLTKEFELKPVEIKRAEALSRALTGKSDVKMISYSVEYFDDEANLTFVECKMYSNNMQDKESDIHMICNMADRRKSYATLNGLCC